MEKVELRQPYLSVERKEGPSYGGNQHWSTDRVMQGWGCGVTAAADLLLYRMGRLRLPLEDYVRFRQDMRRRFWLLPRFGIDGLRLALGLDLCFRRCCLPLRCFWGMSRRKFDARLRDMLGRDLPVILAVGPNVPLLKEKGKLTFYSKNKAGGYEPAKLVSDHYVTATGADGDWLRISSWGNEYYISLKEYASYVGRCSSWLFSNLMVVRNRR